MPINDYFNNSKNSPIILFQIDLLKSNLQWINIGSGIWEVNFDNIYSFVSFDLLDGFTMQDFNDIKSVLVDSEYYSDLTSLLLVSETNRSFIYDSASKTLYIHFINNDEPILHNIKLGIAFGYSYDTITPINSTDIYEGRITNISNFNRSRDPLFFGKLSYPSGTVTLVNGDGFFDTFLEDNYLYGNQGRILLGFPELDIEEYKTIFTGIVDKATISEEGAIFTLKDKRAQLTKKYQCNCIDLNALDIIKDLLANNYGYNFTEAYYDLSAWNAARELAPNITLNYQNEESIINIIETICASTFGFFDITPEGLFTFRFININQIGKYIIYKRDIFNKLSVEYNPSEVLSSVSIGYNKDWVNETYTIYDNITRELDIFDKYKTYTNKKFNTALISLSDSQNLSETILDYVDTIHGTVSVILPIKYHNTNIGDIINIEVNRINSIMIGTKRAVIGINLNLNKFQITLKLRLYQTIESGFRIITDTGEYRVDTDNNYRMIEE